MATYWQQMVLKGSLVLIVLVNTIPFMTDRMDKDELSGWWLEDQRRSGYSYLTAQVSCVRLTRPSWWDKVYLGWQWAKVGFWLGLAGGLGWQCGDGARWGWWLVVLVLSHQTRNSWERVQMEMYTRLDWTALAETEMGQEMVSLGRGIDERDKPEGQLEETGGRSEEKSVEAEGKGAQPGISPGQEMMGMLSQVVVDLPIGTNLGLLHMLWMLVSGQLLFSRGAIFPALQRLGLPRAAVQRAWAAFAGGSWQIADLLERWQSLVEAEGLWQEHRIEGYRVKSADLTAFWRPELAQCPFKHYEPQAGKALPAIVFGLVTRIGQLGTQRVPLPVQFVRSDENNPEESELVACLLAQIAATLAEDELVVVDAGFKPSQLQAAGLNRYVVRLAQNSTARRNELPPYQGHGRHPEYGLLVRPLDRSFKDKFIPATAPDRQTTWTEGDLKLQAEFWDNLVRSDQKPGAETLNIVAIYDPRYQDPLLLASPLQLSAQAFREIYRDRWPVEQIPLSAKQMIGAARQFVHAPESCQRLPELALFAGAILTYVAAKLPPIPTGFWDRTPKSTPGRLRRHLEGLPLFSNLPLPARIRQKASVTDHLPKGILGHRRQPRACPAS